ncbi:glycoside hydrolase superfamily [Morchella snyderi]|nr:glycoside hydrolase superfamily [Morchella snyderi]
MRFTPPKLKPNESLALVFEGLDTAVHVYLNSEPLFFSKNMFIPQRVDISAQALTEEDLVLELRFRAPSEFAKEEEQRVGYKKAKTDDTLMGGHERMYLRKAQYHWGWDWGPALASTGPYLPIYLEVYKARIHNLKFLPSVNESLDKATIQVSGHIEGDCGRFLLVEITNTKGRVVLRRIFPVDAVKTFEEVLELESPELWWPHTHGKQPLYQVKVELFNTIQPLHSITTPLGLRRLRLQQTSLNSVPGTSFTFVINNVPIFASGSNWIPGDFFLPRFTHPQDEPTGSNYRRWLSLAKSGNQNTIRVWGGGIVETTDFYNICDELGLLVWQDLLFACGNYPANDQFCASVKEETITQISRVVHHPCLVLICGDNEDMWLAGVYGWDYDPEDKKVENWMRGNFQHRKTLEIVLPEALKEVGIENTGIEYWTSSPFSGEGVEANSSIKGDVHIWDVWHGPMHPYQSYLPLMGRFVSEFGFESPPSMRTIASMLPNPSTRQSQSLEFLAHDKGPGAERRATMYMGENFRFRMDPLEDYVYCAQLLQAEAVSFAVRNWRRNFKGPGEEICSGALVWQLNDNWPAISWAIVDYYLRPKPAFFTLKRALALFDIGLARNTTKRNIPILRSYPEEQASLTIWGVSNSQELTTVRITLAAFDIATGASVALETPHITGTLKPNRSTEFGEVKIPAAAKTVVAAYLRTPDGAVLLARFVSWPEPLKFVRFSGDPGVKVEVLDDMDMVVVTTRAPVKGLVLEAGEEEDWADNCVDVVPGEELEIDVKGLDDKEVKGRWLCDWEGRKGVEVVRH